MGALLVKDLLNLRKYLRYLLVLVAVFALFALTAGNTGFITGMAVLLGAMIGITTFAYDDQAKWDAYALAMPVSRRDVVLAKYALAVLMALAGAAVALDCTYVISLFKPEVRMAEQLTGTLALLGISLVYVSIMLPVVYRFGMERGRIVMLLLVFLPTIALAALERAGIALPGGEQLTAVAPLLPLGVAACLAVSYRISCRIYGKKEF